MTTLTRCDSPTGIVTNRAEHLSGLKDHISEGFWFTITLILFMVMGPFSAPVALMAIFTLDADARGTSEPESIDDMA